MEYNYDSRNLAYNTAMKYMFKTIPATMTKPHGQRQKFQKLMTEISGR